MSELSRAISVEDYRKLAKRRLPHMLFEYIDGGSYGEVTLRRNVADFGNLSLRQRVMRDISALDTSVETLGQTLAMPLGLAPVGMAGMYGRRGEVQAARAAAAARVPFCLSTVGICSVEEVALGGVAPWFQLYVLKDRDYMLELMRRAKSVGSPVLVLTVDLPVAGARYRDVRSGFRGLTGVSAFLNQARNGLARPAWMWDVWVRGRPHILGSVAAAVEKGDSGDFFKWIAANFDPSFTWQDMEWVRQAWDGPLVVKGLLDPDDARTAMKVGAQGIVVSNHGGRQLDGVRSSIAALPAIVDAVGGKIQVYLDGGIRSGIDVFKACALGANACFVGRAWAYALGAGGEKAVRRLLDTLRAEFEVAMILSGCRSVQELGPQHVDRLNETTDAGSQR